MPDTTQAATTGPRKISDIAAEIRRTWAKPYYGALPFIDAMQEIDAPGDMFFEERGSDLVRRFLANARTWCGEDARRIKAELNALVEGK